MSISIRHFDERLVTRSACDNAVRARPFFREARFTPTLDAVGGADHGSFLGSRSSSRSRPSGVLRFDSEMLARTSTGALMETLHTLDGEDLGTTLQLGDNFMRLIAVEPWVQS